MLGAETALLSKIAAAHLLGDFPLQPDAWVREKKKPRILLAHLGVHGGLLALVIVSAPYPGRTWLPALCLLAAHGVIDLITGRATAKSATQIAVDQFLHAATIFGAFAWMCPEYAGELWALRFSVLDNWRIFVVAGGLITAVSAGSAVIGAWVRRHAERLPKEIETEHRGLQEAGRWIGMVERLLIFAAILLGAEEMVGFVIGAKAILRFPEASEKKNWALAEYYLLGTMASAAWAVMIALVVRSAISGPN